MLAAIGLTIIAVALPGGRARAEKRAIPPLATTTPLRFAVAPFANHSGAKALDWLVAGAPFELAEKTEALLHLMPAYDALVVPATRVDETGPSVAAFAAAHQADLVITGYAERPNWELRVGATLWHIGKNGPKVIAETSRQGEQADYHRLLGEVAAELWSNAATAPWSLTPPMTPAVAAGFERKLAPDIYAVTLLGRGLGYFTGALGSVDLAAAERDLKKAVFVAPTLVEGQRMLGELWSRMALLPNAEASLANRAGGKFSYATDLRADYPAALRGAAAFATRNGKHAQAVDLLRQLAIAEPWNLDVRFALGDAAWQAGDVELAQAQLGIVVGRKPNHVPALRVLALMAAARGDANAYITGLERVAAEVPADVDVKSDLASAYTASSRWTDARTQLQQVVAKRPTDVVGWLRLADNFAQTNERDEQLAALDRASAAAPTAATIINQYRGQLYFMLGRYPEAEQVYQALGRDRAFATDPTMRGVVDQARAAIAFANGAYPVAAALARTAAAAAPRMLAIRITLIAALLQQRDTDAVLAALPPALEAWPTDPTLHYFAGLAAALRNERDTARSEFTAALALQRDFAPAQRALTAVNAGAADSLAVDVRPTVMAMWGGARDLGTAYGLYSERATQLAATRARHQNSVLVLLAELGRGPLAVERAKPSGGRACPIGRVAPLWKNAKGSLVLYNQLGIQVEAQFHYLERHRKLGLGAALPLDLRLRIEALPREFAVIVSEIAELRAQWERGVVAELRYLNCTDALLEAAVRDPAAYPRGDVKPAPPPPAVHEARPAPTVKFTVDNKNCPVAVTVWLDGQPLGNVAPKQLATFSALTGQHTLCLLTPSSPSCGNRGTVRQMYLHEGASISMRCPL